MNRIRLTAAQVETIAAVNHVALIRGGNFVSVELAGVTYWAA